MRESGIAIDGSELAAVSIDGVGIVDDGELVRTNDALADVHGYDSARSSTESAETTALSTPRNLSEAAC
ncbi:hypothetical protein [Haloarchaeobius sp. HRN-SO-5]|uniref:hypothetical protein n=1 Tax=Haloarchaeobius sp. HRN-SO-5 TaxID=3446118 RepID=UPI003EBE6298